MLIVLAQGAVAALLWGGCSLSVDTNRVQCTTDDDCTRRGPTFAGSICEQSLCRPAASGPDAKPEACVGRRCPDGGRSDASSAEPLDDGRECTDSGDCDAQGKRGWICVDRVCWAPDDVHACEADEDCESAGPQFTEGRCIDAMCLPNPRFRCERPAPVKKGETVTLNILVRDSLSTDPIPNVHALVCKKLDLACIEPIAETITQDDGHIVVDVPKDFAGYIQLDKPKYMPALYFLPPSLRDGNLQPAPMLGASLTDTLAVAIGARVDPTRGQLWLVVEDCFGTPLEGVSFQTLMRDPKTLGFYVRDLLPLPEAMETDGVGNGGFLNFPAGNAVVESILMRTGLKLTTSSVFVRPGHISVAYVRPDPR